MYKRQLYARVLETLKRKVKGDGMYEFLEDFDKVRPHLSEECNSRKDAKMLADLNLKVASVSRLCQSPLVYRAMLTAGSPCPLILNGKLVAGRKGLLIIKKQAELYIPDYKEHKDWYNGVLGIGKKVENEV